MSSTGSHPHLGPPPTGPHSKLIRLAALALLLAMSPLTLGAALASAAVAHPYPTITVYVGSG